MVKRLTMRKSCLMDCQAQCGQRPGQIPKWGKGYNEMSMNDSAGKDGSRSCPSADMNTTVENDKTITVNWAIRTSVKSNKHRKRSGN
jgi:uncharacterized protein involved in type VI secretion and phage assembly